MNTHKKIFIFLANLLLIASFALIMQARDAMANESGNGRYALIDRTTGEVVNVIVLNPSSDWAPPAGQFVIPTDNAGPGDIWDGKEFKKPDLTKAPLPTPVQTNGNDVAEFMQVEKLLQPGDVVSISNKGFGMDKAGRPYDKNLLGVVSTSPGITLDGSPNILLGNQNKLALNGRVPVKVSSENGPVLIGDALTSSSLSGISMKALKPGQVIGRALERFSPNDSACPQVASLDEISWPNDDGNNPTKPCFKLPNGVYVGKIMLFINLSWFDPDIYLTSTGNLSIAKVTQDTPNIQPALPAGGYSIQDTLGQLIDRVGVFAELAVANFRTGLVKAAEITTDSLAVTTNAVTVGGQSLHDYIVSVVTETLNSNKIISPITQIQTLKTDFLSPIASDSAIALSLENSQLSIFNPQISTSSAVAVIDNSGNISTQGNLSAQSASISGTIVGQNLGLGGDATISGTLKADKIIANNIEGLNMQTSTLSAQYITNNYYNSTASPSAQPSTSFVDIASYSAQLAYVENLNAMTATFTQGLMAFGPASLSDTSIVGQLSINGNLILADNSINVLGATLAIQPLRQGNVEFMGGLVSIDTEGNLKVGGNAEFARDVKVGGTLSANILAPIPGSDLIVKLNNESGIMNQATNSASIHNSQFSILNSSGSAVLGVNQKGDIASSGSATFNKLNLSLVQPAFAISDTEILATGSAGVATISAQQREITIDNTNVTDKSLIYVTPVGENITSTPYLMRQVPNNSFTVGIQNPIALPTTFNWLIVN